jgi:hypothetical protein
VRKLCDRSAMAAGHGEAQEESRRARILRALGHGPAELPPPSPAFVSPNMGVHWRCRLKRELSHGLNATRGCTVDGA